MDVIEDPEERVIPGQGGQDDEGVISSRSHKAKGPGRVGGRQDEGKVDHVVGSHDGDRMSKGGN